MGIFVRNMRTFKCCTDCIKNGFRDAISCDEWKNTADLERCVSLFCPITDIETPHGDLIDRDKLLYYDYPLDNLYQVELADAVIPEEVLDV